VVDVHGEQRPGCLRPCGHGAGPAAQLDEGVGPALRRRAAKVLGGGGVAVGRPRLGPLGPEQLVLDQGQRRRHHLAADRVQHPVEEPEALDAGREVDPARRRPGLGLVLDPVASASWRQ
jgi:hypothetical protein